VGARVALRLRIGPAARHRDVTFSELHRAAAAWSDAFSGLGCRPGQRVALLMPHSERQITMFLGALHGGLVPSILAWPTTRMDAEKYARNVRSVVHALRADWLLTDEATAAALGPHVGEARVVPPESLRPGSPDTRPVAHASGPAFIQFSGGTTGPQKSVPISHALLRRQVVSYAAALAVRPGDAVVSWLPLYHDMGLVTGLFLPLLLRLPVTLFSPTEWVMDPRPFLRSIGADRATLCWLPNFAFSFLAARAARDAEADLSSLRAVVNCSEPVRAESLDAFLAAFAPRGLSAAALHTCYAMAETTFAVTQSTAQDPPRRLRDGDRTLVSCGRALPGFELRVVDDLGVAVAEGARGEIQIRGGSLMEGYLDDVPSADGPRRGFAGGWYQTGDLGALVDGHLYVTARKKDVIIAGGVNVYPEDVESAVGAIPGIHAGRVAVLGVDDAEAGTQRVVVVAEVDAPGDLARAAELEQEVRRTTLLTGGVAAQRVLIVAPKWIVKSTAGKISRAETMARVLARG
jgi:fatty-acyl-CoA synthase